MVCLRRWQRGGAGNWEIPGRETRASVGSEAMVALKRLPAGFSRMHNAEEPDYGVPAVRSASTTSDVV